MTKKERIKLEPVQLAEARIQRTKHGSRPGGEAAQRLVADRPGQGREPRAGCMSLQEIAGRAEDFPGRCDLSPVLSRLVAQPRPGFTLPGARSPGVHAHRGEDSGEPRAHPRV